MDVNNFRLHGLVHVEQSITIIKQFLKLFHFILFYSYYNKA